MPVLRIIVLSDISIVNTEAISPHLQDKSPWLVLLAGGGAGSSNHGAGSLVTAQPEAAPREGRSSAGAGAGLRRINFLGPGFSECLEKIPDVRYLLLLRTQDLRKKKSSFHCIVLLVITISPYCLSLCCPRRRKLAAQSHCHPPRPPDPQTRC